MSQYLLSSRAMQLIDATAQHYGYEAQDMIETRHRTADVVLARQVAMYMLRYGLKLSLPQIGKALRRDHTTVLGAIRKIENLPGARRVAESLMGREFPVEAPTPEPMVTDQSLRQFLVELDDKMERGRQLRRLLTGRPQLEVAG